MLTLALAQACDPGKAPRALASVVLNIAIVETEREIRALHHHPLAAKSKLGYGRLSKEESF